MEDYKKMYLTLMDTVERAIQLLINAQQQCEDIFVEAKEGEKVILADFGEE